MPRWQVNLLFFLSLDIFRILMSFVFFTLIEMCLEIGFIACSLLGVYYALRIWRFLSCSHSRTFSVINLFEYCIFPILSFFSFPEFQLYICQAFSYLQFNTFFVNRFLFCDVGNFSFCFLIIYYFPLTTSSSLPLKLSSTFHIKIIRLLF